MAGEGYIGDTRGQQFIQQQSKPEYWINTLISNNPNLKSDPYLVQSLTQMFKNSTDPQQLAHSTFLTSLLGKTSDQIGLSNLYPSFQGETVAQDRKLLKNDNPWWAAANTTSQWFSNLVKPIGNALGGIAGGALGFLTQSQDVKNQVRNFWSNAPGAVAGFGTNLIGKAAVTAGQVATGGQTYNVPKWNAQDPLYLGAAIQEGLSTVSKLPFMADTYISNFKSQANRNGIGDAMAQLYGQLIPGLLIGGGLGAAAEGASIGEVGSSVADSISVQDEQVITSLTEKLKTEGELTAEEQAALEKAKQDLTSRDKLGVSKLDYQNGIKAFEAQDPNSLQIMQKMLNNGSMTQQEFDQAIAESLPKDAQPAFSEAANAINGEEATTRAAQDAAQAATIAKSDSVWQNLSRVAAWPVGGTFKTLSTIAKALGSTSANATYILGAIEAQQNPQDSYIWQLAEQGKVLNSDGTTSDLGISIANSLGIDGMWGTSIRDLTDIGLKWVVDDPIASWFRVVHNAKSFYGITGALGKWFSGTGITEVGDVWRAYMQYSSVSRAVRWIATHGAADISKRFSALFLGTKLINELAKAGTDAEVLAVLERAAEATIIKDRITRMPVMGWYTFAKTALTGETGKEFATLADALAMEQMPSQTIVNAIKEEIGVDITPHDVGYSEADSATKAEILFAQRLRRQFSAKQMIIEGGRITDRKLVVGSSRSVNAIMQWASNNYMSADFVNMVGDQLLRFGDDPQAWRNIYDNILRTVLYRRVLASGAHSDFVLAIDKIRDQIDEAIAGMSGVDGGGMSTGQAMIADTNDLSDKTINLETGKMTIAAADDVQTGERILPSERQMRQLSRSVAETLMHINKSNADDFLRSTAKTFEVVRQLAETAGVKAEPFIKSFNPAERADQIAESKASEEEPSLTEDLLVPRAKGYRAKGEEIIEQSNRILESDALKKMTDAERYASVVKYLDEELSKARDAYVLATRKNDEILKQKFDPEKANRTFGTKDVPGFLQRLYGEMTAVQDLGAEMKAAITSSFDSNENISKQASYMKSLEDTPEAGEKYAEIFKDRWMLKRGEQVGRHIGIGKMNLSNAYEILHGSLGITIKSLGERGYRSNFDAVVDFMQGYLNNWFKILTLATPAWAERVTISEVLLNSLRIGGHEFTESKLAQSIAKNQLYLGKVAIGDVERKAIRYAISNIIVGFGKGIADTLAGKDFNDFIDFATNLYMETDGHMLGGVHAQGDLMSEDGFSRGTANMVAGRDRNGNIKVTKKMLGENFRRRNASDLDAGAALYEALSRARNGTIFKEAAKFQEARLMEEGQKISDRHPEMDLEYARQDAIETLKKNGIEADKNLLEVETKKALEARIRKMGAGVFSNDPIKMAKLRSEMDAHIEKYISNQPEEWRANFRRDREKSAKYPNLTAHQGWAKTVVDHIFGLTTDVNTRDVISTIFPDMVHQIASKEAWDQKKLAQWLEDSYLKGDPVPGAFPAHEYIPVLSAGNFNPLRKFSDALHRRFLGPIVNSASRDPLFVWEAWQKFKELKPLVDGGYITMGEAMIKSQTEALVNMSKFVHNPLDKTIWEENMRVLAPYYFAKNQAMRRAFRVAGDNFAAFEKYLKINLAVTDYVALAYNQSGIGSFTFPGSTVFMGFTNGIIGAILKMQGLPDYGALKNMSLQSSPSSPDSVIITGNSPSFGGLMQNILSVPFGPIFTIPAKLVYEQMQFRVPVIAETIKWLLGPTAMSSSIWSDMFPNSTLQNTAKLAYGHFSQGETSSYLSAENYVLGNQFTNIWTKMRDQATQDLLSSGRYNSKTINSGAAQALINYNALNQFSLFMENKTNQDIMQSSANWATTALYVAKIIASTGTPLSSEISSDKNFQTQLSEIAQEKNSDGSYKYPTYTQQLAELLSRFPNELFDSVAHTSSPFSTYNENIGTVTFVNKNQEMVKDHPYVSAFLAPTQGKNATYSPAAASLFASLGLRQRQTPEEYIQGALIAAGNEMYYNVMLPQFQKLYPGNYADGLSSSGYYQFRTAGQAYANNANSTWGQHEFGGASKANSVLAYDDLKSLMSNPKYVSRLSADQQMYIPKLIEARDSWVEAYKQKSTNESSWYDWCSNTATLSGWSSVQNLILGVFIKLPPPQ